MLREFSTGEVLPPLLLLRFQASKRVPGGLLACVEGHPCLVQAPACCRSHCRLPVTKVHLSRYGGEVARLIIELIGEAGFASFTVVCQFRCPQRPVPSVDF